MAEAAGEGFCLVSGGRSRQVLTRAGLAGPHWRQVAKRAVILAAITWVPLLVLTLVRRFSLARGAGIPFLDDLVVHVRLLVALPLLAAGQQALDYWAGAFVRDLSRSALVPEDEAPGFRAAAEGMGRLRDSGVVELLLLAAAYARSYTIVTAGPMAALSSWRTLPTDSGAVLSPAGWWYLLVSLPIYHFLLYRWGWGFVVWTVFLWRLARSHLRLLPTHPDRAGGVGFAGAVQMRFGIVIFALSAVLSATLAQRDLFLKIPVLSAQPMLIGFAIGAVVIALAPLLVFTPALVRCRTQGLLEYADLGQRYTADFHEKWIGREPPERQVLLGSPDIQSLADLNNSFAVIRDMKPVPFDGNTVVVLAACAILPLLPLIFAVVPLASILKKLAGVLF